MTDEEIAHAKLHLQIEQEIEDMLESVFEDQCCRISLLTAVLARQLMNVTTDEELMPDVVRLLIQGVAERIVEDMPLLNPVGSA